MRPIVIDRVTPTRLTRPGEGGFDETQETISGAPRPGPEGRGVWPGHGSGVLIGQELQRWLPGQVEAQA